MIVFHNCTTLPIPESLATMCISYPRRHTTPPFPLVQLVIQSLRNYLWSSYWASTQITCILATTIAHTLYHIPQLPSLNIVWSWKLIVSNVCPFNFIMEFLRTSKPGAELESTSTSSPSGRVASQLKAVSVTWLLARTNKQIRFAALPTWNSQSQVTSLILPTHFLSSDPQRWCNAVLAPVKGTAWCNWWIPLVRKLRSRAQGTD